MRYVGSTPKRPIVLAKVDDQSPAEGPVAYIDGPVGHTQAADDRPITDSPTRPFPVRPIAVVAALIAEARTGAWIAPDGTLYPAARGSHPAVGRQLRLSGDGPAEKHTIAHPWVELKDTGHAVCPRATEAQLRALEDIAAAAAGTDYAENVRVSVRHARDTQEAAPLLSPARLAVERVVADPPPFAPRFGSGHVDGLSRIVRTRTVREGD